MRDSIKNPLNKDFDEFESPIAMELVQIIRDQQDPESLLPRHQRMEAMKIVHDLIYLKQKNSRKEVFTEYETTVMDGSYLDR